MNILVDGRPFCATSAGISRVLQGVLGSWAVEKSKNTFYVVLPKPAVKDIQLDSFPQNVKWIEAKSPFFRHLPNLVYLQLLAPYLIRKYKIDVFYTPIPNLPLLFSRKVKTLVEVNDVVNIEYKDTMTFTNKLMNSLFFSRSVRKADQLWTISDYTRKKIEDYFPQRRCKSIYVGCATDRSLYKKLQLTADEIFRIKERYGIKDRFILFVGSLEPRKNLPFLLDIISEIYNREKVQLVVVGARGWKNSAIKDKIESDDFIKDSTIFCGYVSNEELVELYNIADCFVSSSLNEGFGLPQLEAFLCGCPVVTASNSAMIEVTQGKDGGKLIEGFDRTEWINEICMFVKHRPQVTISQFDKYDWNKIALELDELLN